MKLAETFARLKLDILCHQTLIERYALGYMSEEVQFWMGATCPFPQLATLANQERLFELGRQKWKWYQCDPKLNQAITDYRDCCLNGDERELNDVHLHHRYPILSLVKYIDCLYHLNQSTDRSAVWQNHLALTESLLIAQLIRTLEHSKNVRYSFNGIHSANG